ncbi:dienelactone hydrolase family protein [Ectobacillus panaciterrae]|uniref:dienelactone hydrolase family protein n=1 Tax=Ectobacillus panaciterrae TaxID=363872 RepID=UPI00040DE526|nr:dienelactone hydrolase family protein [Ectobacillus panaciterrae]
MNRSNKDTAVILIHEIYGVNNHMEHMKEELSKMDIEVVCPNLLNREVPYTYSEEKEGYQNFIEHVGFENGAEQIRRTLKELKRQYRTVGIIGFSVGATIGWLCSGDNICDFAVGCYGSRIRDYTDMKPICPTLLIFPTEEIAFDIHILLSALEQKENECLQLKTFLGTHGFMNPFHKDYHETSAVQALTYIKGFIQQHKSKQA